MKMLQNNPNMKEVNELINKYGSPEKAFRCKAQEMGINPEDIINLLK